MTRTARRFLLRVILPLALLAALVAAGLHVAARQVESRLLSALGPRASVGAVTVGLATVTVRDLRIAGAAQGAWPVPDEFHAAEVVVRPGLRGLLSGITGGPWRVSDIHVHQGYLSAFRSRDGKVRLLPALMAPSVAASAAAGVQATNVQDAAPGPNVLLHALHLEDCALELVDASLKTAAPHHVRLTDLDATVGPLALPGLAQEITVAAEGRLKGTGDDGTVSLQGTLTPASHDAALALRLAHVDLVALQPYLFALNDGGVKQGRLDLSLDATVQHNRLHAPGTVTIDGLVLGANADHLFGSLATGTRQALLDVMSKHGRLSTKFTLDGRLDDPTFSLNENLATRVAAGLADAMGVGVQGVVEGVGRVLKGLVGR